MGLMAQLVPTLRVVGEEMMCVTAPQEFQCELYPPNLTVSFLMAGDSLINFCLSHKGPPCPALCGSSINTLNELGCGN